MTRTILVVDDEAPIRDLLQAVLEEEGYAVRCAPDGLAAVAAVDDDPPDLVVADVIMPRLDGLGLVRRLRERGERTPVILVSAARSVGAGADAPFVPKPFDLDRLLATVADALGQPGG